MSQLPDGFATLEPFAADWAELTTRGERYALRQRLPYDQLLAFHTAAAHLLPDIFDHLKGYSYETPLPEKERRLFQMALGLIEVAQAVEVFGQPCVPHTPEGHAVEIVPIPSASNHSELMR